ncbi:hypothetical protein L3X38_037285 [Prunus dulcis]|uniref:Uncharacterized protein n=1 Tax=Prunus dulcis TaxID=3755 RepID=A0AAD4V483_PRUDU|nr:hypothetical protein L3X38_037285 [Prunus dulcis]
MKKQVAKVQASCPKCSTIPSIEESFIISFAKDWKAPYLAFFIDGTMPTNSKHARKLKKTVKRYFIDDSTLYRKGFNGEPLKCLESQKHNKSCKKFILENVVNTVE